MLLWTTNTFQIKFTFKKVLIRPIASYACETWATKTDENKLSVFEREILLQI